MSKPRILVLGAVGFIGRNFVTYLVENDLASKIRIVDKVIPKTAFLTARHQAAFDKVEFLQKNLVNPASIAQCFEDPEGKYDYVFNLAAETKYSQTEEVYNERVYLLSVNCAKEAAKQGVKMFVEVSTAQVYDADKKPSDEGSKIKPWTLIAKYKLKAEEEIKAIDGLNYCIVRPAIVYGPGDITGITPRIIIGAVYKQLGEEMKFLWSKDLRINTVHVTDVCRALLLIAQKAKKGDIYNLADSGDTSQETVASFLRDIYQIKTDYQGSVISNFAMLNLESVTEDINDKHLQPWSELCKAKGISSTPLTPYLDKELLYNNSLSINGSKITTELGFKYEVPEMKKDLLLEVIKNFIEVKAFPSGLIN
jgi:nucleoside-diphosphate-sugar epimerase